MGRDYDCPQEKDQTYALKIIDKSKLHQEEINVIRGESKILKSLVGKRNVVQFKNIFETKKFIIIQMEHLKGSQMKRELRHRLNDLKKTRPTEDDSSSSSNNSEH